MTENEEFPLIDTVDRDILMHRDVHFGGNFDVMLEYYEKEGKGIQPDFEISRIKELAILEKNLQQNLAALLLTGAEAEQVAKAKQAYKSLRELYEDKNPKTLLPRLVADLILSEEEEPNEEIRHLESEKEAAAPLLIDLLRSEDFHNPLFPGYGQAPILAARCLGKMKSKRALISLFEAIEEADFFDSEVIIRSLKEMGETARDFLLKILAAKPITDDNEKAAIALIQFKEDPAVSSTAFKLLHDPDIRSHLVFATYLIMACENLEEPYRSEFLELAKKKEISTILKQDMKAIAEQWRK